MLLTICIVLFICYIVLFGIAFKIKDNSIVDVFWGIGFLIISIILFFGNKIFSLTQIGTLLLILIWSLRISISIGVKKNKIPGEDKRYAGWRKQWKSFYIRSFFQIYLLQMLLMIGVSVPLFIIFSSESPGMLLTVVGMLIAIIGFSYETLADKQLKAFLVDENRLKNTIFRGGLWKYSRHPNYLGEIIFWTGITIISIQYSVYGIFGLLLIIILLLFVSGVPLKEKSYKNKKNADEYLKNTPLFIPNFSVKKN